MKNKRIELADVVRRFQDDYVARFGDVMMPSQTKALKDIAACMTARMGGHRYRCEKCGSQFWVYHGCRNRACPACHGRQICQWLQERNAELLPCDYYHLVATVPEELRHAMLSDQKYMYSLLMRTTAHALVDLARDRKYIGATPGILAVLHTWTSVMHYHPHVHMLITGGGVSNDGANWHEAAKRFLVPVRALSKLIAARMRDTLKQEKPEVFEALPQRTWRRAWCSFCKHYGSGKQAVLDYLARYVFRIAITNARIIGMDDTHVTFRCKGRKSGKWNTYRLTGVEFLRRFLMHVLPKGFQKVRYYGLWHHSKRPLQRRAWVLLSLRQPAKLDQPLLLADVATEVRKDLPFDDPSEEGFQPVCPRCGSDHVIHLCELARGRSP
jgi:hypothetical protein